MFYDVECTFTNTDRVVQPGETPHWAVSALCFYKYFISSTFKLHYSFWNMYTDYCWEPFQILLIPCLLIQFTKSIFSLSSGLMYFFNAWLHLGVQVANTGSIIPHYGGWVSQLQIPYSTNTLQEARLHKYKYNTIQIHYKRLGFTIQCAVYLLY